MGGGLGHHKSQVPRKPTSWLLLVLGPLPARHLSRCPEAAAAMAVPRASCAHTQLCTHQLCTHQLCRGPS
jgi:hypothetical protein